MATPSLFDDCHAWIEKGHESWKSYFSKWETFAKYEENVPESELVLKLGDRHKAIKSQSRKKVKEPFSQKRWKESFESHQSRRKKLIKKEKSCRKKSETSNRRLHGSCSDENSPEIIKNTELEITLKAVFTDFLKADTNKLDMFNVLFQTFSEQEVTFKNSHYLFPKQQVLSCSDSETNVSSLSFENQQSLSSPVPKFSLKVRSICPPRDVYVHSLCKNSEVVFRHTERKWEQCGSPRTGTDFTRSSFNSNSNKQQCLTPFSGSQASSLGPRQNLDVRSCPSSNQAKFSFKNLGLKSIQLGLDHKFASYFCSEKEYFKYATISKMNISKEGQRVGNLCLHKRTNSVEISNLTTPERKSTEQNCLNKIVSQRRHPSKKLFFDNEVYDSESDDQTEYRAPLIHCANKRLKTAGPVIGTVESDSDDCQSIFDRIVKT